MVGAPEDDEAASHTHRRGDERPPQGVLARFRRKPEVDDDFLDEDAARAFVQRSADLDHRRRGPDRDPQPATADGAIGSDEPDPDQAEVPIAPVTITSDLRTTPALDSEASMDQTDDVALTTAGELRAAQDALVEAHEAQRVAELARDAARRSAEEQSSLAGDAHIARSRAERDAAAARDQLFDAERGHEDARARVTKLETDLAELSAETEQMESDRQEARVALAEARQVAEELREELRTAQSAAAGADEELAEAQQRLSDLERSSGESRQALAEANDTVKALRTQLDATEADAASTNEQLAQARQLLSDLERSSQESHQALTEAQRAASELRHQLQATRAEAASALETAEALAEQHEIAASRGDSAQADVERLSTELDQARVELARLEHSAAAQADDLVSTKAELSRLTSEAAIAQVALDEHTALAGELDGELATTRDQLALAQVSGREAAARADAAAAEVERLTSDLADYREATQYEQQTSRANAARVAELAGQLERLTANATEASQKGERDQVRLVELRAELDDTTAQLEALRSASAEGSLTADSTRLALEERVSGLQKELIHTRDLAEQSAVDLRTARAELDQYEGRLAREASRTHEVTVDLDATRMVLSKAHSTSAAMTIDLENARAEVTSLKAQLADTHSTHGPLAADLEATRERAATAQAKVAELGTALEASRAEVAVLEARVTEAETARTPLLGELDAARERVASAESAAADRLGEVEELRREALGWEPRLIAQRQEFDAELTAQRVATEKSVSEAEAAVGHAEVQARIVTEQLRRARDRGTELEDELARVAATGSSASSAEERTARLAAERRASELEDRAETTSMQVTELTAHVTALQADLTAATTAAASGTATEDHAARLAAEQQVTELTAQVTALQADLTAAEAAARVASEVSEIPPVADPAAEVRIRQLESALENAELAHRLAAEDAAAEVTRISAQLRFTQAELATAKQAPGVPDPAREAELQREIDEHRRARSAAEASARDAIDARRAAEEEADELRVLLDQAYAGEVEYADDYVENDVAYPAPLAAFDAPIDDPGLDHTAERPAMRDWLLDPLEEFPAPPVVEEAPYFPTIFDDVEEHEPYVDPLLEDAEYAALVAAFDSAMSSTAAMVGSVEPDAAAPEQWDEEAIPPEAGPEEWAAEWYSEEPVDDSEAVWEDPEAVSSSPTDASPDEVPTEPAQEESPPARMLATRPPDGPSDGTYSSEAPMALAPRILAAIAVLGGAGIVLLAVTGNLGTPIGIGAIVLVVVAVGVALQLNTSTSTIEIERGTMNVVLGERHHTFYLNRDSTQLDMTGEPGDRDWCVQVMRKGMTPVVIDAKSVDPQRFTAALRVWRPEL